MASAACVVCSSPDSSAVPSPFSVAAKASVVSSIQNDLCGVGREVFPVLPVLFKIQHTVLCSIKGEGLHAAGTEIFCGVGRQQDQPFQSIRMLCGIACGHAAAQGVSSDVPLIDFTVLFGDPIRCVHIQDSQIEGHFQKEALHALLCQLMHQRGIGRVERGLNSPTISSLQSICLALGISLTDLFSSLQRESSIVRAESRPLIFNDHDTVIYHALSNSSWSLQTILMDVNDNTLHQSTKHIVDEFGLVLSGSMIMYVEGEETELFPGDSFFIPANSSHCFRCTSEDVCSSIWVHYDPKESSNPNAFSWG